MYFHNYFAKRSTKLETSTTFASVLTQTYKPSPSARVVINTDATRPLMLQMVLINQLHN